MSETSSDAESSCGWTIISNEGSDIETLGSEITVDDGVEPLERAHVEEAERQDAQVSVPRAACVEERTTASLDDTAGEPNLDETLHASDAGDGSGGKEHVLSFSDHSDIVTLGELKDEEHAELEQEASAKEESYLGTSSSSQYAFTAAEAVFPVQQPAAPNSSSSSEDEAGRSGGTVIRRRRLRKNTTSTMTDPEEEAMLESRPSEDEEEEEVREQEQQQQQQEELTEVRPAGVHVRRQWRSIFITCFLLGLLVALCMGFSHFYGKMFHEDPEKFEFICGGDGSFLFDDDPFNVEHDDSSAFEASDIVELDDTDVIYQLREQIEKLKTENLNLAVRQMQIQTERDDLQMSLIREAEERTSIVSEHQRLSSENQQLKNSLEQEEKSLAVLQEELRNMRSQIRDLEAIGSGADSLLLENQRLKQELEEEKQLIRDFHGKRGDMMAEAQTLRKKLEKESKVTDELRREMSRLKSQVSGAGKEANAEKEELHARVRELEKKLSFEQQRSDLWEKLYVETKEDQAKGDTESNVKKPKRGVAGKMKDTFDAVKNSTKEFVHHHKEQIKKAKQAVKENLRKFSDSVKSTFRHFKDSASTFMDKARGIYDKKRGEKNPRESWQHRSHKHHDKHKTDSFQSNYNTRKSGGKVHEDPGHNSPRPDKKGCSGVYDCAYQESTSLFNKAIDPIRADEFYQLLQSYLQQEAVYFRQWQELEAFINNYFHNGVFIHDRMLFTDFVSRVGDYLVDLHKYNSLSDDVFGDLDDYIYRHFFGEAYVNSFGPRRPFEKPHADSKEESRAKHHQRKQQRARSRAHSERKWSRSERNADRHMADVKIELGPMPFDPKY